MRFTVKQHQVEPLDLKRFKRVGVNALHSVEGHFERELEYVRENFPVVPGKFSRSIWRFCAFVIARNDQPASMFSATPRYVS